MAMFLHVRGLHGFGDFEEGFMVEWGKKLVIGTNYFTDPMGNVLNFEFEDDLIKKGIFRIPYHFEEFYELEDLHYICTLLCGDRYFRIRIFDTYWTEIEYPGLGNSYITEEDLVWSRFLSSFRVKLCPTEVNLRTLLISLFINIPFLSMEFQKCSSLNIYKQTFQHHYIGRTESVDYQIDS